MRNTLAFVIATGTMASLHLTAAIAAASTWSHELTECYAQWGDDEQAIFSAEGIKFVPVHKAIEACTEWARTQSRDEGLCHITQCVPVPSSFN